MVRLDDHLTVASDLLVDRHYRGAIVMVGLKMFAVSEESAHLIERVKRRGWSSIAPDERSALATTVAELVERGVLCFVPEPK